MRIEVYQEKWQVIRPWQTAPTIDGRLDEPEWASAATLSDFRTAYFQCAAAGGIVYRVGYDQTHLFLGGSFDNDEASVLDKVEVILSPAHSGRRHAVAAIPVTPTEREFRSEWNLVKGSEERQRSDIADFQWAVAENAEGVSLEAAIPWTALGCAEIASNSELRINIAHIHHLNTQPLATWYPVRTSSLWDTKGPIRLSADLVNEGRLGSLFVLRPPRGECWQPDDLELAYTAFIGKRLAFRHLSPDPEEWQYEAEWQMPDGAWSAVADLQISHVGERVQLDFTHPEPLQNGTYRLRVRACPARANPEDGLFAQLSFDREALVAAGIAAFPTACDASKPVPVMPAPASENVKRLMRLIPTRTGFRFTGLPEMPELHPDSLYKLSPDGESLIAMHTQTVYPNPHYPETKALTAINRLGETVEYPYYEDGSGKRYFLSAHLWYLQRSYSLAEMNKLTDSDPLGAARLLYAYAQAFAGYVPTTDYIWHNYPQNITAGPPFNYWGGLWSRWSASELSALRPILQTFTAVRKTNALEVLSREIGEDVEALVLNGVIAPSLDYALAYPRRLGNMDYTSWLGLVDAAAAARQPDLAHRAAESLRIYVQTQHLSDGFWHEVAPSYHAMSTGGIQSVQRLLRDYADPPGYVSPRTGSRLDPSSATLDHPLLDKAGQMLNRLALPNGHIPAIQDTWAADKAKTPQEASGALLLPQAGVGRLSLGVGACRQQLYMLFAPKYGHNHYDPLSLLLYAKGQELLPDLGYTYTKYRYFTLSTLGHNTVVVDGQDMPINDGTRDGGRIESFAPLSAFQMIRASVSGYHPAHLYSREPWQVSFADDLGSGYVVDLFRVSGGSRHEYTLNGDADCDAEFITDLPKEAYGPRLLPPGIDAVEAANFNETGEAQGQYPAYLYVKAVECVQLSGQAYEVTLRTKDQSDDMAGLHITGLLEPGQNELFLGRAPSIRSSRQGGKAMDTNDRAVLYDMPKLVHRREGAELNSAFVTVMEPFGSGERPQITSITRFSPVSSPSGAVAVKVEYGDVADYVLSSPLHPDQPLVVEDIEMIGESGFIRVIGGVVRHMTLLGGTRLKKGEQELLSDGCITGTVVDTIRRARGGDFDAIVTDTIISTETADQLLGRFVIVEHPDGSTRGFEIADISGEAGRTVIRLAEHDPGFEIEASGSSKWMYFPGKTWEGKNTFRIALVATMERHGP